MEVAFVGPTPDLTGVPGVESAEPAGPARLRFSLNGHRAPVLRAIVATDAVTLEVREPTLAETFLDCCGEVSR